MDKERTTTEAVIDRKGALWVGVSSGVAGFSGLVIMLAAARMLPISENDQFVVFWSTLFAAYAVLGGTQQEATRAAGSVLLEPKKARSAIMPVTLGIGLVLVVIAIAAKPWWGATVLPHRTTAATFLIVGSVLAYAGHLSMVGILMGRRQWRVSSTLIGAEALARLGLVLGALVWTSGLDFPELAVALPAGVWLVTLALPEVRAAVLARADVDAAQLARQVFQAMGAGLGTAVLIVGFPAILRASTDAQTWAGHAPLAVGISLTRAALLMPLNAFQGAATGYFLDPVRPRSRSLIRLTGFVVLLGVVLAGVAGLAGPWLLGLLRPEYVLPAWLLIALTLAAALMGLMTLYGAVALALGRHGAYAVGWLAATGVAIGVLFLGLPLELGAVVALSAGPAVGIAIHLGAVARALGQPAVGLGATAETT